MTWDHVGPMWNSCTLHGSNLGHTQQLITGIGRRWVEGSHRNLSLHHRKLHPLTMHLLATTCAQYLYNFLQAPASGWLVAGCITIWHVWSSGQPGSLQGGLS